MDNVRNNREYDALSKEVEFQKLEIELQQKRIREAQKAKSEKEEALEIASRQYEEKKADLEAKKAELEDIIAETHKDEEELIKKSEQLSHNIEERLLTAYKRIRSNARNGLAVVTSTVMPVVVVSIIYRRNGNWISVPARKLSSVNIAVVSLSTNTSATMTEASRKQTSKQPWRPKRKKEEELKNQKNKIKAA